MIGFFIALLSGALMSVQGVFNTEVTKVSSIWTSAAWVQLSALITCLIAWGLSDRKNPLTILQVTPKYMLLGGVIAYVCMSFPAGGRYAAGMGLPGSVPQAGPNRQHQGHTGPAGQVRGPGDG